MASAGRSRNLPIFVRFNSNTNIPVQADPQWNVSKLKEEIGERQAVDPKDIRIIFAGRELRDDLRLKVLLILFQINFHYLFFLLFYPQGGYLGINVTGGGGGGGGSDVCFWV